MKYNLCAFLCRAEELLAGCSFLLIGQLPPVMDMPLYTTVPSSELSDLGSANCHMFYRAVMLDQVMRQAGQDDEQTLFRDLLLYLRNGKSTLDYWSHLMKRTIAVGYRRRASLNGVLSTTSAVSEHNLSELRASDQPVATIKAIQVKAKLQSMMQEDWSPLSTLHMELV